MEKIQILRIAPKCLYSLLEFKSIIFNGYTNYKVENHKRQIEQWSLNGKKRTKQSLKIYGEGNEV